MNMKYPPLNMQLRNGKVKLQFPKCRDCNEFYAYKKYKYKCSGCYKGLKNVTPWKDEEFRNSVNKWAEEKIKISNRNGGLIALSRSLRLAFNGSFSKERRVVAIYSLIEKIKKSYQISNIEFYISAKDGEELLRRTGIDVPEKSHLICPLILDWWNMKKYRFHGFEMCYYGRYGDEDDFCEQIKSIPPPPPHKNWSVAELIR